MQKSIFRLVVSALALFSLALPLAAQEGPLLKVDPPQGMTPEDIIQRFAAKETQFKLAREKYTYRQTIKVQTLDGNTVDGDYDIVFDVLFDNTGKRMENVVFAPQPSLERIQLTPQDEYAFRHLLPFVVTTDELPEYNILYVGKQKEDELNTYVFDLAPKELKKGKMYFQGRIWVDDRDFQIVKTHGRTVPEVRNKKNENLFPAFTTWREQIDGKYWFPTYTRADDTLHFSTQDVHVREIIKYTNYKRFGSNVKITYEGQDIGKGEKKPADQQPQPQPQQQQPPAQQPPQQ